LLDAAASSMAPFFAAKMAAALFRRYCYYASVSLMMLMPRLMPMLPSY